MRERSRFLKSVTLAREAYENRRRKFPPLLAEDHTTIAAAVLNRSFWPFSDYPLCTIVNKAGRYPCNLTFPNRYTIEVPRYAGSHWDFLHQLAHWCMPLEGHNQTFCTFYAVLVDAAFGKDGSRRLLRAYDDCNISHIPEWLQPVGRPVAASQSGESCNVPSCPEDSRIHRYGT
jgi:hypothetical protein